MFLLTFFANWAQAQYDVSIGLGTSTQYYSPINRWFNNSASEILYYGSEIGVTGTITDIKFDKASGSNSVTIDEVFIYMKTTSATAVTAAPDQTTYTLVYQGAYPNDNTGWIGVTLDTPFAFSDASQNLSVLVVKSYQSYTSDRPYYSYTTTSASTMAYYQSDGSAWSNGGSMNSSSNRPNVQFTLSGVAACSSPTDAPTALTLTADSYSQISGSFTAAASAPDTYMVVRSTASTLTETPVDMTSYSGGDAFGGGMVVQVSPNITFTDAGLDENTTYYYFVYSLNGACSGGPLYYATELTSSLATPYEPPMIIGASNITANSATINWVSSGASSTYALDIATDAAFTTIVSSYTGLTATSQDITGLSDATMYYARVMLEGEGSYATINFTAMNDLTPITVTGFNADVIANGTGSASASTNNVVDGGVYAFLANGFNPSGTVYTNGLPEDRVLVSEAAPVGLEYFMAAYDQDNDLRLGMDGDTGTLTLTTPLMLQEIYLGVTGGSGSASFTAEVTYDDATSDTFTSLNAPDWFGNSGYITTIGSRVSITDDGVGTSFSGPRIYAVTLDIPIASELKNVVSITFTSTTGVTSGDNVLNIFAMSGKVSSVCSGTPNGGDASLSATSGGAGTTFTATATNISDAVGVIYQWQMSADGVTWTDIAGATTVTYDITAESSLGTYYYRLTSICEYSSSMAYSTEVSYTTVPCTPSYNVSGSSWSMNNFSIIEVGFSDATMYYSDHDQTDVVIPDLTIGDTYTFEVDVSGWMSVGVAVNLDMNGTFSDTDEILATPLYEASSPNTYSFSVTIPSSASVGVYTMRLWNREANSNPGTDPCGSYNYGTYADYSITLVDNLAVESVNNFTLETYPNPVKDYFTINTDTLIESVAVYTITGQQIKTQYVDATKAQIDMKNIASGVYFVRVVTENSGTQTIKILKQ
ncbi:hypothetical protein NBRC110019_21150 [Neptunitalea chrysea]|uniref:T9SS type A sorting domain-containing protein n=1 Tax=Neptunitalea chrysea TaxID=1647581 RepID=A0A9W6EU58_9FLAO|nr:hypothetical protein NBRC110019_21150 [Neptunitalea chrysea]